MLQLLHNFKVFALIGVPNGLCARRTLVSLGQGQLKRLYVLGDPAGIIRVNRIFVTVDWFHTRGRHRRFVLADHIAFLSVYLL